MATVLTFVGRSAVITLTKSQAEIMRRSIARGGEVLIRHTEVASARVLERLGAGTLTDNGSVRPHRRRSDGERWTFSVAPGAVISEQEAALSAAPPAASGEEPGT